MNLLTIFLIFIVILSLVLYQYKYPISKILWIVFALFVVYTLIVIAGMVGMMKGASYEKQHQQK